MSYKYLVPVSITAIGCFTLGVIVGVYLVPSPEMAREEIQKEFLSEVRRDYLIQSSVSSSAAIMRLETAMKYIEEIEAKKYESAARNLATEYLIQLIDAVGELEASIQCAPKGTDTSWVENDLNRAKKVLASYGL